LFSSAHSLARRSFGANRKEQGLIFFLPQMFNLKPAIETADYTDNRGYHKTTEYPTFTRRESCLGSWFFLYPDLSVRFA
jgi:hypothetical protein